jgi:adenylate cyclase
VGLLTLGISALARDDLDRTQIAVAVVVLVGVTLLAGTVLVVLTAHAIAGPIQDLRDAVARLDDGDLGVELEVYDGTEIGLLQAGFNRAVAGLRDRERVRDLFGRHVGEEVARSALEGDVGLGGEEVEVAVLFVDVIGSTQLASRLRPQEVVDVLNRFFEVVIDVVDEHHGLVNKFAGDAVLAVFGAPTDMDDAAGAALAAARTMGARLAAEVDALEAGIGVAAGRAVAGNVGHARRFEYTVIGDAVNEASRLCDLAKQEPGRVLASMRAVERARDGEPEHWTERGREVLRGRDEPTRIATPRD